MEFLIKVALILFVSTNSPASIVEDKAGICNSHESFYKTYEFLKTQEALNLAENQTINIAIKVSEGCNDAYSNFRTIYLLLKNSGVATAKTLQEASKFAKLSSEQVNNFHSIFEDMYFKSKLDMPFNDAWKLSLSLSEGLKADWSKYRNDFRQLTNFCISKENLDLPMLVCNQLAVNLIKKSAYYPDGLSHDFVELVTFARKEKQFGLNQKEIIQLITEVIANGPGSLKNFKNSYQYAVSSKMNFQPSQAIKLALQISKNGKVKE